MDLDAIAVEINEHRSKYQRAVERRKEERVALALAQQQLEDAEQAQQLLQTIAQQLQQQAHLRIASVVSKCLQAVFHEPYIFRIDFERKRGKTEARLLFERDGETFNPIKTCGGGVVDVAAFALRVACLVLKQPTQRRLVVMDEPFKFLSAEYRERIPPLLETLAEDLGIQFIFVTHFDDLKIGKVIHVR